MAELYLILLDAANGPAFDSLFQVTNPDDDVECTTISDPEHTAAVNNFLVTHRDALLLPSPTLKTEKGVGVFYSWDGEPVKDLPIPVTAPDTDQRRIDYIAYLQKLIFVEMRDKRNSDGTAAKSVHVSMDPLPLGQRIGMFFRTSPDDTWSILYEQSVSKLEYIDQLIHHKGLEELGLKAQLTIYKFANGTEILSRNYMLQPDMPGVRPLEGAGTMYIRNLNGTIDRFMVPEDSFVDFFEPKRDYLARLIETYGPLAHQPLNVTHASQCAGFVEGETQFAVYRTQRTKDRNTISGNCLQRDEDGDPVIQSDTVSMLEPLIKALYRSRHPQPSRLKQITRQWAP